MTEGLQGKAHMLILSVNVGGGREALEWALGHDCIVLLIQEHRMLGNPVKGMMNQAKWMGLDGGLGRGKYKR